MKWYKMLKRREEWDTYLTHVCRYHWSRKSPVKRWNIRRFQPTLWLSSMMTCLWLIKVTVLAESSLYFIFLLGSLATLMSTDMSQAGVALLPSFLHFLSFYLPRFSFYISMCISTNRYRLEFKLQSLANSREQNNPLPSRE